MHELSRQQAMLSTSLERLTVETSGLLSSYADHARVLDETKNTTVDLLDTVVAVADNIATIEEARHSSFYHLGISRWMPYIISPVATLLLGSYGLEPSAMRNLSLVALGEVVGFMVSQVQQLTVSHLPFFADNLANNNTMVSL